VVLLTPYHGFTHIGLAWTNAVNRGIYERLAEARSVVLYDRRGNGLSKGDPTDCSFVAQCRDLAAVVAATSDAPCAIVGMGYGGPAAIRFAAENPGRVSHLVLYDTFLRTDTTASDSAMQAVRAAHAASGSARAAGRTHAALQGANEDWFATYSEAVVRSPEALDALAAMTADAAPWAPRITCPTLVIHESWPDEEATTSTELAAAIPYAELHFLERDTQDPWEDFADFSAQVTSFLGLARPRASLDGDRGTG
jgi:pimeloyl-ACP methyl ester carboxylesterase